MRFAYADPPYLDKCGLYDHFHGTDGRCWDDLDTHRLLIDRLSAEWPDGWALSGNSSTLQRLLPLCPPDVRVLAWVKPFAAFKRNVRVAYTWEPVIVCGGRASSRDGAPPCRDHIALPITMRRGFTGAKPEAFCRWVMDVLGWLPGDELTDLFTGSGVFDRVLTTATGELPYQEMIDA